MNFKTIKNVPNCAVNSKRLRITGLGESVRGVAPFASTLQHLVSVKIAASSAKHLSLLLIFRQVCFGPFQFAVKFDAMLPRLPK